MFALVLGDGTHLPVILLAPQDSHNSSYIQYCGAQFVIMILHES